MRITEKTGKKHKINHNFQMPTTNNVSALQVITGSMIVQQDNNIRPLPLAILLEVQVFIKVVNILKMFHLNSTLSKASLQWEHPHPL